MSSAIKALLGDLLNYRKDFIRIDDFLEYQLLTVKWYGLGVVERSRILGSSIRTKQQQVCRSGDFIVAEIDAKEGSFGIVPEKLDGAIVSSHYYLYEINKSKILPQYLEYYIQTREFISQVSAQGTTNYSSIRPHEVLDYTIPLPSLEDQRQIVQVVGTSHNSVNTISQIYNEISGQLHQLLYGVYHDMISNSPQLPMLKVAPIIRRPVEVNLSQDYYELGVRSFGKGTFHKPALKGIDIGSKRIFWLKPNDLVFSNVFAWEGAIAIVQPEDDGRVGSHRFISCVPKDSVITSEFLYFHFQSPNGLKDIQQASPGGAGRNRTLGLRKLEKIMVPVPDYNKQLWFGKLLSKVKNLYGLQDQLDEELDELRRSILNRAFDGHI